MDEALLKKLRYKEGRAVILGAPDGYAPGLELGDAPSGEYDFVQLFVRDAAEVAAKLPTVIAHLKPDAVFWLTYPKQSSKVKTDVNRDTLAAQVQELTAFRPVSNVAIDDTWSALRLRHRDLVRSK
ncbi:MAG TPA: hypothetical protein VFK80_06120 [Limnochordia bacterium]|nr:hypothetical protein [Limnochordia bacterium]